MELHLIQITKDTLRQLNAAAGKLDVDSGQVFVGFVGRRHKEDGFYHGELRFEDPGESSPQETTSIQTILSPPTAMEIIEEDVANGGS